MEEQSVETQVAVGLHSDPSRLVRSLPTADWFSPGPELQMPVPPKGFGGHGALLCVFGGVLLFHPCG
jgi:hypothetical protein